MDKFLEKYNLSKMNEEESESLKRPITADEIETLLESSRHTKALDQMVSQENFGTHLRENLPPPSQIVPENPRRWKPPKLYEASIILITKSDKDITKKENFRPILLINIDAKVLNKILANLIQQCVNKIIHHDQVGFIPGTQGWYNIYKSIHIIHHIKKRNIKII